MDTIQCPFCDIQKQKTKIISSNDLSFVIFSNPRLIPGHLLVIPRRHVEKLSELTPQERHELWDMTIKFQEKIITGIAPGCDIRQNYRPFLKQSQLKVNHLHIHLLPREKNDRIFKMTNLEEVKLFGDLDQKEVERILPFLSE